MQELMDFALIKLAEAVVFADEHFSAVVAFCVMFFTAYQAYITRAHNIISVRPAITINLHTCSGTENNKYYLELYLRNSGLGPAKITSFNFYYRGKIVE